MNHMFPLRDVVLYKLIFKSLKSMIHINNLHTIFLYFGASLIEKITKVVILV